ncbi:hypothetical protein ACROYT_G006915 [Oculina patagonica]
METTSFRSFLLRVSDDITKEKLEQIKYLCSDDIPERDLEIISSPLQLFKDLERRQMIGIDNLSFLQKLLTDVTCLQLVTKVDDFISRREVELFCLKTQRRQVNRQQEIRKNPKVECVPLCGVRGIHPPDCIEGSLVTSCSVTDGEADNLMTGRCSCFIHPILLIRESQEKFTCEFPLSWLLKVLGLQELPLYSRGILVKYLCEGSVICVLEANDLQGLKELWQRYESGKLREALEEILITEELRKLAVGQEIILNVDLDENMYRDVCLELMVTNRKVDQIFKAVEQRPRSLSDPIINQIKKPDSTFQHESLHIVAKTERKRRLDAEKKLEKLVAGQSLELHFPELQEYIDKNYQDDTAADGANESDDNSSTTSTLDEEEVLDWEDENDLSKEFWSSVKGSLKEKKWSYFEDAVKKTFADNLKHEGTPLIKKFLTFLAYVLRVNYAKRASEKVSLHNFIRLTRWFGPFTKGPQGSLQKMIHLMKNSASIDSDGKRVSWFAGYMTEQQAKEKLRNENGGAFLVRFNTPVGFLLSKKSRDVNSVVDFAIEVHKDTGHVSFGDRVFDDLPSLVKELQKSWMTDLRPFYSTEGTGTDSPAQES